ncbi:hypothetical protein C8R47DRAFT_1248671 [Mycena vitilis]|nr:hypothetical protein C8R47DRAFT_1248671 [Mycena vitilis]
MRNVGQAWGALLPKIANPLRLSVVKRSRTADHDDRPPLTMKEINATKVTHRTWSASDCVPTSYRDGSSDHTWVEREEEARFTKQISPANESWTGKPDAQHLITSPSAVFSRASSGRIRASCRVATRTLFLAPTATSQASTTRRNSLRRALHAETTSSPANDCRKSSSGR